MGKTLALATLLVGAAYLPINSNYESLKDLRPDVAISKAIDNPNDGNSLLYTGVYAATLGAGLGLLRGLKRRRT